MNRTLGNILLFSILAIILIPLTAIAEETSMNKKGTIVAVGDSLTAGFGVDFYENYPALLQEELEKLGLQFTVINSGVSGETSSGTRSRIDWILDMKPDIVILETGANDGLRGIPPVVPKENITKIIKVLQENDVTVVLAGMQMIWNLGEEYTNAFNAMYPEIAEQTGVIFMPFFLDGVATNPSLNQEDGLHPNREGYKIITKNILPFVLNAIERFSSDLSNKN